MRPALIALLFSVPAGLPAGPGVVLVQKRKDFRRGEESRQTIYVEPTRVAVETRRDGRPVTFVYLADKGILRVMEHDRKIYREMTEDDLRRMSSELEDRTAEVQKLMKQRLKRLPADQRILVEHMKKSPTGGMGVAGAQPKKVEPLRYQRGEDSGEIEGRPCEWWNGLRDGRLVSTVCTAAEAVLGVTAADFTGFVQLQRLLTGFSPDAAERLDFGAKDWKKRRGFPGIPLEQTWLSNGEPTETITLESLDRGTIGEKPYRIPPGYQMRQAIVLR